MNPLTIILNRENLLPEGMFINHAQKMPHPSVISQIKPYWMNPHGVYFVFASGNNSFWALRTISHDNSEIDPFRNPYFNKTGELIPSFDQSGKYRGHNYYEGNKCYSYSRPLWKIRNTPKQNPVRHNCSIGKSYERS